MNKKFFLLVLFPLLAFYVIGQQAIEKISVSSGEDKQLLAFPWAGGLNAVQVCEMDFNLDGMNDLLLFERHGDKMMPFVYEPNEVESYTFIPSYIGSMPQLHDWVITRDFDKDGRMDIFTYSDVPGGITVFRNISDKSLKFEAIVYPHLLSFQGAGYTNILVTEVDYPAIEDLDSDGDLDLLTFRVFGSWVEMHKNLSIENYGHVDSLVFERTTMCWGSFAESEESNELFLDTCFYKDVYRNFKNTRHTGSTFTMFDQENDGDFDLLLGDFDYPGLIFLGNDGNEEAAYIGNYISQYPLTHPINLFSMPLGMISDINHDGTADLLVSVFDPRIDIADNYETLWFYSGVEQNSELEFFFETDSFLQDQMLDFGAGAYPVFTDYNGDNLTDIVIGNYGYHDYSWFDDNQLLHSAYRSSIALLLNEGSQEEPAFHLITRDLIELSAYNLLGLVPTFGDVDGDLDLDMIIGKEDGTLIFVENQAGNIGTPDWAAPVMNFMRIDVSGPDEDYGFSVPQLFDLNKDGLLDLTIGKMDGTISYYLNNGTLENPSFVLENDFLGEVNVTDFNTSYNGYSTPYFFINQEGETNLLVGSERGIIFYFTDIDDNLNGAFIPADIESLNLGPAFSDPDRGLRTSAAIADIDADEAWELVAGSFAGGLELFSSGADPEIQQSEESMMTKLKIYPNPTAGLLIIDGAYPVYSHFELINCFGERIQSGLINKNLLPLFVPENGLYFIRLTNPVDGELLIKRIVVTK